MNNNIGTVLREQLVALGLDIPTCPTCGDSWELALNAWGLELAKAHRPSLIDIIKREANSRNMDVDIPTANELIDHCFSLCEKNP